MPGHIHATHRITVDAPIDRAFMFFTPAGEELWVDGWLPTYLYPNDGCTKAGMVFTTGQADDWTIWTLIDFERSSHRSRYSRCTPATRTGSVEIQCSNRADGRTDVLVTYTLTALNAAGEAALADYEGSRFEQMIEGWSREISARLDLLMASDIA